MKKIIVLGCACMCALFATGCASVAKTTTYDVKIATNAPEAKATVRDGGNGMVIAQGKTPLTVNLESSDGFFSRAKYTCEVVDLQTDNKKIIPINGEMSSWFWGNFVIGGILGMAIDGATGAMYYIEANQYVYFEEYSNSNPRK
jgi:hypothetical protein